MVKKRLAIGVAAALILLQSGIATAGATPQEKCQSGKNKAAGKYAACRQNAEAKLVTSSDATKYGEMITKCETKFTEKWKKLEDAAAAKHVSCPDAPLTASDFKTVIDGHSANVTAGLSGASLVWCGNGIKDGSEACDRTDFGGKNCASFGFDTGSLACTASCSVDTSGCVGVCGNGMVEATEQCDQDNLNGKTCVTQGFAFGTLTCGPNCQFNTGGCYSAPILVDNGDGTITDKQTGLMWEKKDALDGIANAADPHDADNTYTLAADSPLGPPGTAYTVFLAQLNGAGGFAGHTDWRLPTREELEGIVDYADTTSPVVDAVFDTSCSGSCAGITCSCTGSGNYWSSTIMAGNLGRAWIVNFADGSITLDSKDTLYFARAVRP